MNEEFDLRNRLAKADPATNAPSLNEGVVASAALGKPKRITSFRTARFTMSAASLSILGLAVGSVTILQPTATQPLFSLAGSNQGQMVSADASASREMGAAEPGFVGADSMMIWPSYRYEYVAGDLSKETSTGRVYQAELVGDPIEILGRIAEFFGIEAAAELDDWSTPEFPSYSIQQENTSLGIYFSGAGNWYYSNWNSDLYSCTSSASSEDSEERIAEDCSPKPTPELIPQESDLIAQATRLFRELGFPVDQSQARVWRNEWGASVSFANIQNGIQTGLDSYVGWDARGVINYVSGFSFKLVERGSFETISPFDAVARIADGRWYGAAPASYYEQNVISYDAPAVSEFARDESAVVDGEVSDEGIPAEKEPEIIFEEPEIRELRIDRSEAVTLSVFDSQGNYWFVPGYLLFNQDGWFDSIISLEDGVIELPEPFDYEILPAEVEPLG